MLEPQSGYLTLAERLYTEGQDYASWQQDGGTHPHEANYLKLDISKAKARLGWQPRWNLAHSLGKIVA